MSLPGERFASLADHAAWQASVPLTLADRHLVEASPPERGTCAPCLRPTEFSAGRCDCFDRLDEGDRALLHAAVAEAGLCAWSRLRLIGTEGALAERLAALAGRLSETNTEIIIIGMLAASPGTLLADARKSLVDGGCLLARVAFDPQARQGRPGGPLGWDLLDLARGAGFSRAEMLRPWSRELGYLGGGFLLRAIARARPA